MNRGILPDDAELLEVLAPTARVLAASSLVTLIVDARWFPRRSHVFSTTSFCEPGHLAQARPVGRIAGARTLSSTLRHVITNAEIEGPRSRT